MRDTDDGFREFFVARRAALSRTAYFLAGSDGDAQDLLQEAMVAVAARWPRLRTGNPEAYARQVMLNRVRSRWRRRQRVREETTDQVPEAPDTRSQTDAAEVRQLLAGALRRLAPGHRAVLYLRFYEDLSPTEVAPLLGVSVGTVKSQTHDALARLRRVVPELAPDEIGVRE